MSEIEKQFFETFGIPPLCCKKYLTKCMIYDCENYENFDSTFSTYPQITDRILLELVCIHTQFGFKIHSIHVDDLRKEVLSNLRFLQLSYDIKSHSNRCGALKTDIQALFKDKLLN